MTCLHSCKNEVRANTKTFFSPWYEFCIFLSSLEIELIYSTLILILENVKLLIINIRISFRCILRSCLLSKKSLLSLFPRFVEWFYEKSIIAFYWCLSLSIDYTSAIVFISWDKDNKFHQSVKEIMGKAKPTLKSKNQQYRLGRIQWIWLPCNFVYHSHRSKEKRIETQLKKFCIQLWRTLWRKNFVVGGLKKVMHSLAKNLYSFQI